MSAAVEKLLIVDGKFFRFLAYSFCDTGHRLAFALVFLYFLQQYVGGRKVDVQIVVKLFLYKVTDEFCNRWTVGTHVT